MRQKLDHLQRGTVVFVVHITEPGTANTYTYTINPPDCDYVAMTRELAEALLDTWVEPERPS